MITIDQLKLYHDYRGDADGAARSGNNTISGSEWGAISNAIQDINLIRKGLCSEAFQKKAEEKIRLLCDSEQTQQLLYTIAEEE